MAGAVSFRARGNEPFWSIDLVGDELRWTTPDTPESAVWSGVTRTDRSSGFDLRATRDGQQIDVAATRALCRDTMSGMPFPHRVSITLDGLMLQGCGGEAIELLAANEWTVASIDGSAVVGPPPTLVFGTDGRASGFGGCNRWASGAALTGEGLTFDLAASTMMACAEEAMRTEQAFLAALARVTRHDFDAAGPLLLKAGDETVIHATPTAADAGPPGG